MTSSINLYKTVFNDSKVFTFFINHCHLYPSQSLSKMIMIFLLKEIWLEDENARDDYVDLILKLIRSATTFKRDVTFKILGFFTLALASRFTTKLESTTKYCKEGLELIKNSQRQHEYFWIYLHIVLAHSFISKEDMILPLENVIKVYPKHGYTLSSLAEIYYSRREYEKALSIYNELKNDRIFRLRAQARIAWIESIEFVLLEDLNPIIESLQPLTKFVELETTLDRKDFLVKASNSRDSLKDILDNESDNMDNLTHSWVLFWLEIGRAHV